MWIGSCVTLSGRVDFILFLVCLVAALTQVSLLCLTNVCAGNVIVMESPLFVLAPVDCAFNSKFEGNAAVTFCAGVHAAVVAVFVAGVLVQIFRHGAFLLDEVIRVPVHDLREA